MNTFFKASLLFNILFAFLLIVFIYRKGGISFLYRKINNIVTHNVDDNFSVYYNHKKSQFELLDYSSTDIIFLGDSITDEGEWSELLHNPNIKNRGIGGDTTTGILARIDKILAAKPQKIFLMTGINDLASENKSVANTLKIYKNLLVTIQSKSPQTKVFIQSLLPVNNQKMYLYDNNLIIQCNSGIKLLAQEFNYEYIDVFSHLANADNQLDEKYTLDGVHLNGKAYFVWKEVIKEYINQP